MALSDAHLFHGEESTRNVRLVDLAPLLIQEHAGTTVINGGRL